jgi:hypothetical protein
VDSASFCTQCGRHNLGTGYVFISYKTKDDQGVGLIIPLTRKA